MDYNPDTGDLIWRTRTPEMFVVKKHPAVAACTRFNKLWAGKPALNARGGAGYRQGMVFCEPMRAHRAAWAIYHGEWPDEDIDHINGNRSDNRIANLRHVGRKINLRNRRISVLSAAGFTGVAREGDGWKATIGNKHIAVFGTIEEAIAARLGAEVALGYGPNHTHQQQARKW